MTSRFCACIENSIKELIPVQQILQTYMSQESRDIDLDGDVEDTQDPDIYEGEPEPEPEPEPMMEPEPEPTMEPAPDPEMDPEFKSVPGVAVPEPEPESDPMGEPQGEQEDDVLFGDAPEYPTKKVGYN